MQLFFFIGLFVPYGPMSSFLFLGIAENDYRSVYSLVAFFVFVGILNKFFNKKDFSLGGRILINLLVLLILTAMVDLIRSSAFDSWELFLKSAILPNLILSNTF